MWAPVYDIAKLGPQLGMARPEGLSLKTRSARMEPVALQQTIQTPEGEIAFWAPVG